VQAGERAGWTATGGSPIGESAESPGSANPTPAPGWARQLRREQMIRSVDRLVREGDAGGASLKPNLRGEDR
jgi:type IV secretory pathway TrbL component